MRSTSTFTSRSALGLGLGLGLGFISGLDVRSLEESITFGAVGVGHEHKTWIMKQGSELIRSHCIGGGQGMS